jgi:hypothetical protein
MEHFTQEEQLMRRKKVRLGDIVGYVNADGELRAAIVNNVVDAERGLADLHVFCRPFERENFSVLGFRYINGVPYAAEKSPKSWHFLVGREK